MHWSAILAMKVSSRVLLLVLFGVAVVSVSVWLWELTPTFSEAEVRVLPDTKEAQREIVSALQSGKKISVQRAHAPGIASQAQATTYASFGPVDGGRRKIIEENLRQEIDYRTRKLQEQESLGSIEDPVEYYLSLHMLEIARAKMAVLGAGKAFLCDKIPDAPPGFIMPATTTGSLYFSAETQERVRNPKAYVLAHGESTLLKLIVYVIFPIELDEFPAIRAYVEEHKRFHSVEIMDRLFVFNSYEFDRRRGIYERHQELVQAMQVISESIPVDGTRLIAIQERLCKEGIPTGLDVTPPDYLARPRWSKREWKR